MATNILNPIDQPTVTALPYMQAQSPISGTTPSTSSAQQQISNQNVQAQQQLGNQATDSVLNHVPTSAITNNGWFSSNVTAPINAWGNTNLGTVAGTSLTASGASATANLSGSIGTGVGGSDAFLAAPSTAGTTAPAWTGATLSDFAVPAAFAYAGYSYGGQIAGWTGGNPQGGQIGGAIGGAIGSIFGGPIGGGIGIVVGSTIGGLFGNNTPSDMTQNGGVNISTGQVNDVYARTQSGTGSEYSPTNAATRNTEQIGASNLAQFLLANGATPTDQGKGGNIMVTVGQRDGIKVGSDLINGGLKYDSTLKSGTTGGSLNDAVSKEVMQQYNIPDALKQQLNHINSSAFYDPNFNLQNAIANPTSLYANGQNGNTNNFMTPTVATSNTQGRGILNVPVNTPTGKAA